MMTDGLEWLYPSSKDQRPTRDGMTLENLLSSTISFLLCCGGRLLSDPPTPQSPARHL